MLKKKQFALNISEADFCKYQLLCILAVLQNLNNTCFLKQKFYGFKSSPNIYKENKVIIKDSNITRIATKDYFYNCFLMQRHVNTEYIFIRRKIMLKRFTFVY